MLHELLLTLWGNRNTMYYDEDNYFYETLDIYELSEFIHPAEKQICIDIIKLARDYVNIKKFAEDNSREAFVRIMNPSQSIVHEDIKQSDGSEEVNLESGQYLQAFSEGILISLEPYQNTLIELENKILNNVHASVSGILSTVIKFRELFSILKAFIHEIKVLRLHGCQILDRLCNKYDRVSYGVQPQLLEVLKKVNDVFYKQLACWILHGEINDLKKEFFISVRKTQICEQLQTNFSHTTVEIIRRTGDDDKIEETEEAYVDIKLVPSFLSEILFNRILFIGNIVRILLNDPGNREITNDTQIVWKENLKKYQIEFKRLANNVFIPLDFERTIENVRLQTTEGLWQLVVRDGYLLHHLKIFRDYALMNRGDLNQDFFSSVLHLLPKKINKVPIKDLQSYYDALFDYIKVRDRPSNYFQLNYAPTNKGKENDYVWLQLTMIFKVKWPLHLIFTSHVQYRYSLLFRLLSSLKFIQIKLHDLWCYYKGGIQKREISVWLFLHNCLFLVNNFQYYLQVDVIENHYTELMNVINETTDFEKIINAHSAYITNVITESFLVTEDDEDWMFKWPDNKSNPVLNIIMKMLLLINDFCIKAMMWNKILTDTEKLELEEMYKLLKEMLKYLLHIYYNLQMHACGKALMKLLLRLDFKSWIQNETINK